MASARLKILHEDNHLLAVAKPAGPPTMGAQPDVESVLDMAKEHLRQKYDKPGNVYLGVVSRLDAPVSGVLLFARTSKAAARLTEAFRTRKVEKLYLATVAGEAPACETPVVHYMAKDERNQRMYATHAEAPDAKRAELTYRVLCSRGDRSLLTVRPVTGRKHQIRVQLAKIGLPIVGDAKYGGPPWRGEGVALHCQALELEHPVRREPLRLTCEPAAGWAGWRPAEIAPAQAP